MGKNYLPPVVRFHGSDLCQVLFDYHTNYFSSSRSLVHRNDSNDYLSSSLSTSHNCFYLPNSKTKEFRAWM